MSVHTNVMLLNVFVRFQYMGFTRNAAASLSSEFDIIT
jgi:hypothetical protein